MLRATCSTIHGDPDDKGGERLGSKDPLPEYQVPGETSSDKALVASKATALGYDAPRMSLHF